MAQALEKKTKDTSYYIKSIIGVAFMLFFGLIPAPAPITAVGMKLLGLFIGLVFLWTTVDMVWPSILGIALFGFIAFDVYPDSTAMAGVYDAGARSIGNFTTLTVLFIMVLCGVLNETGLVRRIGLWFLTRKIARRNPWSFTFMLFLACFVIGVFMDSFLLMIYAFTTEIFLIVGVDHDDEWAKVVAIGMMITNVFSVATTPICHVLPVLLMGTYSGITGQAVNWIAYMGVALPVCLVGWILMLLFFRFVVKPDMSKLKNLDFEKIEALKTPMSKKEKLVVVCFILLVIFWVLPGFLDVLAPQLALTQFLDTLTMLTPILIVLAFFAVIRVDGEPVLNFSTIFSKLNWTVVMLLAGIMMISSAMSAETTGITPWVIQTIGPMFNGMSPFMMLALLCLVCIILTNFASNVTIGLVLVSVSIPLAQQAGVNPFIVAMAVSIAANLAFAIPPAFVPVGICYAYPYGGPKYTLRWGVVAAVAAVLATALLIYPLCAAFGIA